MADSKITALASIGTGTDPANDPLVIVDVSDILPGGMSLTGTTKKVTLNNLLACSPTATLASATISGDLTVRTNRLVATTTGVGIGTTTLFGDLNIQNGSNCRLEVTSQAGGTTIENLNNARNAYLNMTMFADAYIWNRLGSEAMRLNSTGLGVGGSPTRKLSIVGSGNTYANINSGDNTSLVGVLFGGTSAPSNGQIIYNNTDNSMGLHTAGAVKLTIDSSGNVGIGVTPSAWNSAVPALQVKGVSGVYGAGSSEFGSVQNCFYNASSQWIYGTTAAAGRYAISSGVHQWFTAASGTLNTAITDFATAKMTLDASGNLNLGVTSSLINTTRRLSVSGTVAAALQSTGAATVETINVWHTATSGNNIFVDFDTEAAVTSRGSISYNRAGGLVAYNTTSDYRAKDIIGPVSNSGSLIDSLKVYAGKMKGATIERPMLIAHEAQEVAPYAVTGTKDEVDADGKPKYQQMDASALVPLLIAEIQSLRARVQTLETR